MAAQQTYDLFNYLLRATTYPLIQNRLFNRHLLTYGQWSSTSTELTQLDDYCLAHIFQYLSFRDLVHIRHVCRRLHHSVDEYLDTRKHFTYTCDLNGMQLQNGNYHFNLCAFEFCLQRMPNLRSFSFEKCSVMKYTLANCSIDILAIICTHLYDLKMFHITRSLSITPQSISQMINTFNELTHLTINIFSEDILAIIIDGLSHLIYLNLDESILYDYEPILSRFKPNIRTFIAPEDLKDNKINLVEALTNGNFLNFLQIFIQLLMSV